MNNKIEEGKKILELIGYEIKSEEDEYEIIRERGSYKAQIWIDKYGSGMIKKERIDKKGKDSVCFTMDEIKGIIKIMEGIKEEIDE